MKRENLSYKQLKLFRICKVCKKLVLVSLHQHKRRYKSEYYQLNRDRILANTKRYSKTEKGKRALERAKINYIIKQENKR